MVRKLERLLLFAIVVAIAVGIASSLASCANERLNAVQSAFDAKTKR